MKKIINWIKLSRKEIILWYFVGFLMLFFSTFVLFILVDLMMIPLAIATIICAEIALIFRFVINHFVIFKEKELNKSIIKFHIASAGGFIIWWITTNTLNIFGIHYLVASILAVGLSTIFNFLTNFLWIWKKK